MAKDLKPGEPGYRNPRYTKILDQTGAIKDDEEIPMTQKLAVCRNPGCPAEGVVFEITVGENLNGEYYAICIQCHNDQPELRDLGELEKTVDLTEFRQKVESARRARGPGKHRKPILAGPKEPLDPINRDERKRDR